MGLVLSYPGGPMTPLRTAELSLPSMKRAESIPSSTQTAAILKALQAACMSGQTLSRSHEDCVCSVSECARSCESRRGGQTLIAFCSFYLLPVSQSDLWPSPWSGRCVFCLSSHSSLFIYLPVSRPAPLRSSSVLQPECGTHTD